MTEKEQVVATVLSVNLNKIALLRNSRGRNYPNVVDFARQTIQLGVKSLTIHPRQDERHIHRQDARDLAALLAQYADVELNIEGYPNESFCALIEQTRPHQVTLVPDDEAQLTSDHGWDLGTQLSELQKACRRLKPFAGRIAVFIDPGTDIASLKGMCDRIELYTEAYAVAFAAASCEQQQCQKPSEKQAAKQAMLQQCRKTVEQAHALGLGVNAGHDLDLANLADFLTLPHILEVSIGHALTVEALEQGWQAVVGQYLTLCGAKSHT